MTYFSIPYKSNGKNNFFNFTLPYDCVLFAGSRHLSVNKEVSDGLITQFGKLGFSFVVGCCKGVDESFRLALSSSDYAKKTFVACAFKDRLERFKDLSSLLVVSSNSPPPNSFTSKNHLHGQILQYGSYICRQPVKQQMG